MTESPENDAESPSAAFLQSILVADLRPWAIHSLEWDNGFSHSAVKLKNENLPPISKYAGNMWIWHIFPEANNFLLTSLE